MQATIQTKNLQTSNVVLKISEESEILRKYLGHST